MKRHMKQHTVSKLTLAVLFGLVFLLSAFTGGGDHAERTAKHLEHMKAELNLTPDQATKIKSIFDTYGPQRMDLKANTSMSPEEKKQAFKTIRQAQKEEIEAVLTPEQLTKFKAMQHKHRGRQYPRHGKKHAFEGIENGDALRKEIKAYHKANVLPTLKAERQAFDANLSADEKQTLAEARLTLKTLKEERKAHRANPADPQAREAHRATMKATKQKVKAIADQHATALEQVKQTLAADAEQWKADVAAIIDNYATEENAAAIEKLKMHLARRMHQKPGRFLLMDPNKPANEESFAESRTIKLFPNPTNALAQVSFETSQQGKVTMDVLDRDGGFLQTVYLADLEAGTHLIEINVKNLKPGQYFLRISDSTEVRTERFLKN